MDSPRFLWTMRSSGDLHAVDYLGRRLETTQIILMYFNNKPVVTSEP